MDNFIKIVSKYKENMYSSEFRKIIEDLDVEIINESDLVAENLDFMERINLLFSLEYKCLIEKNNEKLAYLNYLISYYIFVILTPPFSEELALKYAEYALKLHNEDKYIEWVEYVKQGN